MNKYLTIFGSHSQYVEPEVKPNVSYCIQEDEVHYSPSPFNGHSYVDLGLPSGTLWAKMNVGANSETDAGLYFAWGETKGYTAEQITGSALPKRGFFPKEYKYYIKNTGGGYSYLLTKYCNNSSLGGGFVDNIIVLENEDDAVNVNWGGDWHTPTKEQCQELINPSYTTNEWVENYQNSQINGILFTSLSNGNKLFIPAAGIAGDNSMAQDTYKIYGTNGFGGIWTNVLNENLCSDVLILLFGLEEENQTFLDIDTEYRPFGLPFRGVIEIQESHSNK